MRRVLISVIGVVLAGAGLAGCGGAGSTEDPREPGERCSASNYLQEKVRDGALWRCTRQWNGSSYRYYWTVIRYSNSRQATTSASSIVVLDGGALTINNSAGDPTWKFTVGGDTPAVALTAAPDGGFRLDPATFVTPQQYQCFGDEGVDCLGVTVRGVGAPQPVTIDPAARVVEASFGITADVVDMAGFPGIGGNCRLGPITGTLRATDYDPVTGTATLVATGLPIGATSSCGDQNAMLNGALGLPGTADVSLRVRVHLG